VADLIHLLADPSRVECLEVSDLTAVLEDCATEHGRLALVENRVRARLSRELRTIMVVDQGLWTAAETGKRLGVSADYVRDHGEELGIAVPLAGVVRYDPVAVEQLRRRRLAKVG